MKKIIFFIILHFFSAKILWGQQVTTIEGNIQNYPDTIINIDLLLMKGMFASETTHEYSLQTKNGRFRFDFPLNKTAIISIYLNGQIAFSPGTLSIIVSPGDSLNFTIPDVKKLGLVDMNVSGKGHEKIILFRDIIKKVYSNRLFKKTYNKQTVTEKFLEVDRSLDIIDSAFQKIKKPLSRDNQLVKAQLVDQSLDMILIHSVNNKSDSVPMLFKKYIEDKKRIEPLLNPMSIEYFGGWRPLRNYLNVYSRVMGGGELFDTADRSKYTALVVKKFADKPDIRDYLLSDISIQIFEKHWDDEVSRQTYNFYVANADKKNPHYKQVIDDYKNLSQNLKPGKPFYGFKLPDTAGKIHELNDFKGKVVVVDFWFTGCSGCAGISPALEKVEEEMKDEAIQFISVNVDKIETWKQGIGKYSSKNSLQLYTEEQKFNHPIIKFAKVTAYPTLIVLDKKGHIVGKPPRPDLDMEGFKSYIKKLL